MKFLINRRRRHNTNKQKKKNNTKTTVRSTAIRSTSTSALVPMSASQSALASQSQSQSHSQSQSQLLSRKSEGECECEGEYAFHQKLEKDASHSTTSHNSSSHSEGDSVASSNDRPATLTLGISQLAAAAVMNNSKTSNSLRRAVDLDVTLNDDGSSDNDTDTDVDNVSVLSNPISSLLLGPLNTSNSIQRTDKGTDNDIDNDHVHDTNMNPGTQTSTPFLPPAIHRSSDDVLFREVGGKEGQDSQSHSSPDIGIPAADLDLSKLLLKQKQQQYKHLYKQESDQDTDLSVQRSAAGPPSEINIDSCLDSPPSPMRDPSVIFETAAVLARQEGKNPTGDDQKRRDSHNKSSPWCLHNELSPPPSPETDMLRTKLCDAERLVKIILGKTNHYNINNNNNDRDRPSSLLDHQSILQAIRIFALMQQELTQLRQTQERTDGDPPAILANLTSPVTISDSNTNSNSKSNSNFGTPTTPDTHTERVFHFHGNATTSSPEESKMTKNSPSPSNNSNRDDNSNSNSNSENALQLRSTRNALVRTAKKCQSLTEQLKQAKRTIASLKEEQQRQQQQQQQPFQEQVSTVTSLEPELHQQENRIPASMMHSTSTSQDHRQQNLTNGKSDSLVTNICQIQDQDRKHEHKHEMRKTIVDSTITTELDTGLELSSERLSRLQQEYARIAESVRQLEEEEERKTLTATATSDRSSLPFPLKKQ